MADVDVVCGVVGVPNLLAPPPPEADDNVFAAFADNQRLLKTVPMRAAISYKWSMYGLRLWFRSVIKCAARAPRIGRRDA